MTVKKDKDVGNKPTLTINKIEVYSQIKSRDPRKEISGILEHNLRKGIKILLPLADPKRKDFTYLAELVLSRKDLPKLTVSAKVPNGTARERFVLTTARLFSRLWRT